jgi:hypothetical protein
VGLSWPCRGESAGSAGQGIFGANRGINHNGAKEVSPDDHMIFTGIRLRSPSYGATRPASSVLDLFQVRIGLDYGFR